MEDPGPASSVSAVCQDRRAEVSRHAAVVQWHLKETLRNPDLSRHQMASGGEYLGRADVHRDDRVCSIQSGLAVTKSLHRVMQRYVKCSSVSSTCSLTFHSMCFLKTSAYGPCCTCSCLDTQSRHNSIVFSSTIDEAETTDHLVYSSFVLSMCSIICEFKRFS